MITKLINNLRSWINDSVIIWWQSSSPYHVCHVFETKIVYTTKVKLMNLAWNCCASFISFIFRVTYREIRTSEHALLHPIFIHPINNERASILRFTFYVINKVSNYYYYYYCIELSLRFRVRVSVSVGISVS